MIFFSEAKRKATTDRWCELVLHLLQKNKSWREKSRKLKINYKWMRQAMVDKRTNLLLQIVYIDMENFTTGRVYIDRRCPSQNKIKGNLKNRFLIASSIFIVYKIRKPREKKCEANNGVWRHCWQLLIFLVLIYSFTTFVSLLLPADWKESVTAETVVTDNNFALKGHTHTQINWMIKILGRS